jgi:hypothetical protein
VCLKVVDPRVAALSEDARWRPIMEKLGAPVPANRFSHAAALRDEIDSVFGLSKRRNRFPAMSAGAMRGRDAEREDLVDRLTSGRSSLVVVQARPGIGLSRFLLESVLAIASMDGPPTECSIQIVAKRNQQRARSAVSNARSALWAFLWESPIPPRFQMIDGHLRDR